MFNCGKCGGVTPPGTTARKSVVATKTVPRPGGEGTIEQTAKEILLCPECAPKHGHVVGEEERIHCSQFRYQRKQVQEEKMLEKARRAHK